MKEVFFMNNINWDRLLQKHDENNADYRRRFMDDDEDEMTEREKKEWQADEDDD